MNNQASPEGRSGTASGPMRSATTSASLRSIPSQAVGRNGRIAGIASAPSAIVG